MPETKSLKRFAATVKELALFSKCPYRRAWRWTQDPTFPPKQDGRWNLAAVRAWVANLQENRAGDSDDNRNLRSQLLRARADERTALARLAELKLAIEQGEYRRVEDIRQWDLERLAILKRGLLALPNGMAHLLVGLDARGIHEVLRREVRDLLTRFASKNIEELVGEYVARSKRAERIAP